MDAILKGKGEGKKHALLSASSAQRWLNCPPSARAESLVPDKSSDYSKEGTLAHAMAARQLKHYANIEPGDEEKEIRELWQYHDREMDTHVMRYVHFVRDRYIDHLVELGQNRRHLPILQLHVERRLDFSDFAPEGFGTGDAVITGPERLEIIDLKYGRGVPVSAKDNPQLKLYALGALNLYPDRSYPEKVMMTIYQPRLYNVSTWGITTAELLRWGNTELFPAARRAWEGTGERKEGDWCMFCKVRFSCPLRASRAFDDYDLTDFSI